MMEVKIAGENKAVANDRYVIVINGHAQTHPYCQNSKARVQQNNYCINDNIFQLHNYTLYCTLYTLYSTVRTLIVSLLIRIRLDTV